MKIPQMSRLSIINIVKIASGYEVYYEIFCGIQNVIFYKIFPCGLKENLIRKIIII